MCNLYPNTTNQVAIAALFRVVNPYIGNLLPMPGVLPIIPRPWFEMRVRRGEDKKDC
jgi:hypothetical protein